jgi:hypothetical protein
MAPVAVAREPHHLPGLAVDGHRLGAGEASVRVKSDGVRRDLYRRCLAAEQLLGRSCGIVGVGEWRQRRWIERAFVLRCGRAHRSRQVQNQNTRRKAGLRNKARHFPTKLVMVKDVP